MELFSLEKESDKETTILKHVEILKQRETCPLWSQRGNLGPMGRIYKVGQSLASSVRERRTPPRRVDCHLENWFWRGLQMGLLLMASEVISSLKSLILQKSRNSSNSKNNDGNIIDLLSTYLVLGAVPTLACIPLFSQFTNQQVL